VFIVIFVLYLLAYIVLLLVIKFEKELYLINHISY
jgi:hypothetical protein